MYLKEWCPLSGRAWLFVNHRQQWPIYPPSIRYLMQKEKGDGLLHFQNGGWWSRMEPGNAFLDSGRLYHQQL